MTLPVFCNDPTYKIEYDPTSNKARFDKHAIGPSVYVAISVDTGTPTNLNRIFVDSVAGDDGTGTGTSTAPYKTIVKSANSCTATQQYVHVLDDAAVFIEDLSAIDNEYFQGIFCATGQTASMWKVAYGFVPADANSIYVTKAGNDTTGTGSLAAPVLTIAKAITLCDATHQAVVIVPAAAGEVYTEAPFEFTGNFLALYGWNTGGYTATVKFTQTAASVTTTSSAYTFANVNCGTAPRDHSSCILGNGNIVLCYVDEADSSKGKFIIKDTAGVTKAGPTVFNTDVFPATSFLSVAALVGGGFITCYRHDNSDSGMFTTWTNDGVADQAATAFNAASSQYISVCVLPVSGYVVVAWRDVGDSNKGKFRIYDPSDWSDIKTETQFEAGETNYISLGAMSNDNFVIAYTDVGDSNNGKFIIYDSSGTITVDVTAIGYACLDTTLAIMDNDNIVFVYADATRNGYFIVYDTDGSVVVASTKFYTTIAGGLNMLHAGLFNNNNFIISYVDYDDTNHGKFIIHNQDGEVVLPVVVFNANPTTDPIPIFCEDNTFLISYIDDGDSDKGKFLYYTLAGWSPVTVSAATTLMGITFDGDDSSLMYRMFNGTAKITAKYCEFMGVNNDTYLTQSHAIYSTAEVDIQNCKIHDNGAGVYSEENTSTFKNNLCYRNGNADSLGRALKIKGTAATPGAITVEHNSFMSNYVDLELEDNHGTNEVVKNNIHDNCGAYEVYAETAMTVTYSIIKSANCYHVTLGTGCISANPLWVNEGQYDEDDTDMHLRLRVLGDFADSPAFELADDTTPDRDAGAYDSIVIGSPTTWSSATFYKNKTGISFKYRFINASVTDKMSGDLESDYDGTQEIGEINHDGMLNAEFAYLLDIVCCGKNQIRFYGDPTTYPSDYLTYKLIYEDIKGYAKNYKLNRTGRQDVVIKFARKYED